MNRLALNAGLLAFPLLVLFCAVSSRADTLVSLGYYDLAPCCGNSNALPSPWDGSANTTFLGNTTLATSSDPDEAAILFTNTGATAVTLGSGVTVTSGANVEELWISLIGAGGFSIAPGASVILSATTAGDNFDGSDIPLTDSTVSFAINGTSYSFVDNNCSGCASGSVLKGWNDGSDETVPWTQVDDIGGATPEPATFALLGTGLLVLGLGAVRRNSRFCNSPL
jgi:hypothetical protein